MLASKCIVGIGDLIDCGFGVLLRDSGHRRVRLIAQTDPAVGLLAVDNGAVQGILKTSRKLVVPSIGQSYGWKRLSSPVAATFSQTSSSAGPAEITFL